MNTKDDVKGPSIRRRALALLSLALIPACCLAGLLLTAAIFAVPALAAPEAPEVAGFRVPIPTSRSLRPNGIVILPHALETSWRIEWAPAEAGHAPVESSPSWAAVPGCTGTITAAEAQAGEHISIECAGEVTGLTPATTYYFRGVATSSAGEGRLVEPATTLSTIPRQVEVGVHDRTATSARLTGALIPAGLETEYRLQYTTEPGAAGSWLDVPGGSGTIPAADATEEYRRLSVELTGLSVDTTYYVRLLARNEPTPGSPQEAVSPNASFKTFGPPAATTLATHAIHGESLRALGFLEPGVAPVNELQTLTIEGAPSGGSFTLSFEGETTGPIPFSHDSEQGERIRFALQALPAIGAGNIEVYEDFLSNSYTVEFTGSLAAKDLPQLTVDPSGLTPATTATVATDLDGAPASASYRFQYLTEEQFLQDGESFGEGTESTPELEGSGAVGADLAGLQPGVTYRYRLLATNSTPGNPQATGETQALTMPAASQPPSSDPASEEPCANAALRTGPSAHLPDCRAYEQITPAAKGGAQDIFKYGVSAEGSLPGEDGNHFLLRAPGVQWGPSPDAGEATYVFSRTAGGWQMSSARPQGEGDPNRYIPTLLNSDLTEIGLQVGFRLNDLNASPDTELQAGPPGGPYAGAASVPVTKEASWVGASADFSTLVLKTNERTLLGASTHTASGSDLYEYSGGELRQANVASGGATVGTCGATLAHGLEGYEGEGRQQSSPHAISADGSRLFFEAVPPGHPCSEPADLYLREAAAGRTVDLGAYRFLAADPEGSRVLLEKVTATAHEYLLYDTEAATFKTLFSTPGSIRRAGADATEALVSPDLSTIYFFSEEQLPGTEAPPLTGELQTDIYRYDVPAEELRFVAQNGSTSGEGYTGHSASPDGRYFYWITRAVGGLPGGGLLSGALAHGVEINAEQVYRYDSAEDVVQCMSCASPFDPEPRLTATFLQTLANSVTTSDGAPDRADASANGDYVFFDTPAALVPADVDGEVANSVEIEGVRATHPSITYSTSSDVYEWRKDGIDGCARLQGCLALITPGTGGYLNVFLGTTPSGRDAFFATHEALVPSDNDTAGDVYDARIGGGLEPPPPPAVECEGDSCSHPAPAPNDPTPASEQFHGAGNVGEAKAKKKQGKKHHPHHKGHKKSHKADKRANANRRVSR